MATNDEFIAQATELAAKLEKDVVTEGLTNAQLGKLVKDLKAEAEAAAGGDAPKPGTKKKIVLQSLFGDKGPGDTIELPKAQAEQMVKDGWATEPKKAK